MAFDTTAFVIAGTAIAIGGVGLYLWDTRKDQVMSGMSSLKMTGGSRRCKRRHHKNTKKRY